MEENFGANMKISLVPFRHINAMADIETQEIFIGQQFFADFDINCRHEMSHIVSGDPDHGSRFREVLDAFGGEQPPNDDVFAKWRKRLGIPAKIAGNIGNISGIQNMLLDYHLLQAYRKFSQKVLGTEGHWEVINEGDSTVEGDSLSAKDQLIRLYPTPKGAFPVVVLYIPVVNHFRSPQARQVTYDMMLAEAKISVGSARRKIAGIPTPDGGSITYDGAELVQEGEKMKDEIIEKAISLGEPLPIHMWLVWWLMPTLMWIGSC